MITCSKRYTDIPFSHRQPNHKGHCRFIHGHNWGFEFEFVARELDECGFVIDFGGLHAVKNLLALFDHALLLNQDDPLAEDQSLKDVMAFIGHSNVVLVPDCSCEGLAMKMHVEVDVLVQRLTDGRVRCLRCVVHEDSKNYSTASFNPATIFPS